MWRLVLIQYFVIVVLNHTCLAVPICGVERYRNIPKAFISSTFFTNYSLRNAFDGDDSTIIHTECSSTISSSCRGSNLNYLDSWNHWFLVELQNNGSFFVESIKIKPRKDSGARANNLNILISRKISVVPTQKVGFRGMSWSDFVPCGITANDNSEDWREVKCNKNQNTKYVAVTREQLSDNDPLCCLNFAEIEIYLYQFPTSPQLTMDGTTVILSTGCRIPNIRVSWYKYLQNSTVIPLNVFSVEYRIDNAGENERGAYFFEYLDSYWGLLFRSKTQKVNVKYKGVVKNVKASNYWPIEGENVTLRCEILDRGNPNSSVVWLVDGIIEDKYLNMETIHFTNFRRSNKGNYSCLTSNSVGISSVVSAVINVPYNLTGIIVGGFVLLTIFLLMAFAIRFRHSRCPRNDESASKKRVAEVPLNHIDNPNKIIEVGCSKHDSRDTTGDYFNIETQDVIYITITDDQTSPLRKIEVEPDNKVEYSEVLNEFD